MGVRASEKLSVGIIVGMVMHLCMCVEYLFVSWLHKF